MKQAANKITQDEFLRRQGMFRSFLTCHNFGSNISERLEISTPYMIMYQAAAKAQDSYVMFELTEYGANYVYGSYSDYISLSDRPLHSHDFYEFTLVLSHEICLQIEDETVTYREGDCCLCNKNIHHKELPGENFEFLLFMFKEDYIRSILDNDLIYDDKGNPCTQTTFFHSLFESNHQHPLYNTKQYFNFYSKYSHLPDEVLVLINSMVSEIVGKRTGRNYFMKGYFCRFFDIIGDGEKYHSAKHLSKLSREEELVAKISLILEQTDGRISCNELSHILGYNEDYLARLVKRRTGQSLIKYKEAFLLSSVAQRLVESDDNISVICLEYGYSNRTFFNKIFSSKYGMSPSEFRRSHLKSGAISLRR